MCDLISQLTNQAVPALVQGKVINDVLLAAAVVNNPYTESLGKLTSHYSNSAPQAFKKKKKRKKKSFTPQSVMVLVCSIVYADSILKRNLECQINITF